MMLYYRDCYLLESTVVMMDGHTSDVITDVWTWRVIGHQQRTTTSWL